MLELLIGVFPLHREPSRRPPVPIISFLVLQHVLLRFPAAVSESQVSSIKAGNLDHLSAFILFLGAPSKDNGVSLGPKSLLG